MQIATQHPPPSDLQSGLSRDLQVRIGQQLRVMFDEIVQGPIPKRLQQLLHDLRKGKAKHSR